MFLRVGQLATLSRHTTTVHTLLMMDKNAKTVHSNVFGDNYIALDEDEQVRAYEALMNIVSLVRLMMDLPVAGFSEAAGKVVIHTQDLTVENRGSCEQ